MKNEKLKRLKKNVVEIQYDITRKETITVNEDVLDRDIQSAEEVVDRRVSELATAEKNLQDLKDLKEKIKDVK